jgi:hypothetical protein
MFSTICSSFYNHLFCLSQAFVWWIAPSGVATERTIQTFIESMFIVGLYSVVWTSEHIDGQTMPPAWSSLVAYEDASLDKQNQLLPDREADGLGDLTLIINFFLSAP